MPERATKTTKSRDTLWYNKKAQQKITCFKFRCEGGIFDVTRKRDSSIPRKARRKKRDRKRTCKANGVSTFLLKRKEKKEREKIFHFEIARSMYIAAVYSCYIDILQERPSFAFLGSHWLSDTAVGDIRTLSWIPRIPFSIG